MANKTQQQHEIVISGDAQKAIAEFKKVAKQLEGLDKATDKTKNIFTEFKGVLGTLAGFQLASLTKDALNAADAFNDMAQRTGIAASTLSEYQLAAKLSDTSVEGIGTGLKGLSKNMLAASSGSKEAAQAFSALGVSVQNNDGTLRTSEEVMLDVAERFAAMPDGAYKSAVAMSVFGKAGADMIPFLNQGKDGIQAMRQEAIDLGVALSDVTLEKVAAFNDSLDKSGIVIKNGLVTAVADLLPGLTKISEAFSYTFANIIKTNDAQSALAKNTDGIDWASGWVEVSALLMDVFQGLANIIMGGLVTPLVEGFKLAGYLVARVAAAIGELANGDLKSAANIFNDFFEQVSKSGKRIDDEIAKQATSKRWSTSWRKGFDDTLKVVEKGNEAIKQTNEKALNEAKKIKDAEVKLIEASVEKQKEAYDKAKSAASKALSDQESIAKEFAKLRQDITGTKKDSKDVTFNDASYAASDVAMSAYRNEKPDDTIAKGRNAMSLIKSAYDNGSMDKSMADYQAKNVEEAITKALETKKKQADEELVIEKNKFDKMTEMLKAFKDEPIKLTFDKEGIQSEVDKTKAALQASLNANPLVIPMQIASPAGMTSAGAGAAAGVEGASNGTALNLQFPFGNFQANTSAQEASAMQKAIARENLKIGN